MVPTLMLEGIKVLDFTHALAGPTCTRLMAELGADVIKIESFPTGDISRALPALRDGRSAYYIQQNRGKKSLCLDLRTLKAQDIIHRLVPQMDVVVQNFTPGVMARLNIDWPTLSKLNPDLIMCSISAFGQEGPLSALPGYDYIAQAYAGVIDMIGEADGPPYFAGLALSDVSTGVHAYSAIVTALFHKARGGAGQHLDITLLDSLFHCHEVNVQYHDASNGAFVPRRSGSHHQAYTPVGLFKGKEQWLMICVLGKQWNNLCQVMGREDMVGDPRFADNSARAQNKKEVVDAINQWLQSTPNDDEALRVLQNHHVPVAPVLSVPQAMAHPHMVQRQTVRTVTDRAFGRVKVPGMPLRFSGFPEPLDLQADFLGESNSQILSEYLGMTASEIQALEQERILGSEPIPA